MIFTRLIYFFNFSTSLFLKIIKYLISLKSKKKLNLTKKRENFKLKFLFYFSNTSFGFQKFSINNNIAYNKNSSFMSIF